MNHLIIGGGPASLSAAATLKDISPGDRVTILCRETGRPYARMALPHLLAGKTDIKKIGLGVPEGVDYRDGEETVRLSPVRKEVETAAGKIYRYDCLLIASGGDPEKPKFPGSDLPFVFTVRNLRDIVKIKERIGSGGRALIAGAGPVGIEIGDALQGLGASLAFVVASNRVLSAMLDVRAAEMMEARIRETGAEVLTGDEIASVRENGEVLLRSGETRKCNLVIVGKGVRPAISFLKSSGVTFDHGIVVDEKQETNIHGIFAAGDAAQTTDIVSGKSRVNALWPAAVEQGRVAALNMAGIGTNYPGSVARNILTAFGIPVFAAGAGSVESGYDIRTVEGPGFYRKIVMENGILRGCVFVGEQRNEGLYSSMIRRKENVEAFSNAILQGSYSYSRYLGRTFRLAF